MKTFIGRLFGFRPPAPSGTTDRTAVAASHTADDNPATIEAGSDNALRRQLVHVLMRDVLRRHGIPSALIECQMMVVASHSRGSGMYVRLVLRQWDERLVRYAFAFQNALMTDILRFEPRASEWLHGISWQFEFAGTCPYAELPEKSFWQDQQTAMPDTPSTSSPDKTAPALAPTEVAAAVRLPNADRRPAPASTDAATELQPLSALSADGNDRKDVKKSDEAEDLERLFAIRDRELGRSAADGTAPVVYEKTQPSPL